MKTKSALDVAAFMLEHLEREHLLYQDKIVLLAREEFGDEFICVNENGNYAFKANVLNTFKKLTGDKVVWCRVSKYWRFRMSTDDPNSRFANE